MRDYRSEDLLGIVELYCYSLAQSPHFARDEKLLEHLIRYAENQEGRVFVATINDEITGCAIVLIEVGERGLRFGNIAELEAKDVSSMNALIKASQEYSTKMNVDAIIAVPPPNAPVKKIMSDWLPLETGVMMAKALSFSSLIEVLIRRHEKEALKHLAGKSFVFNIDREFIQIESSAEEIKIRENIAELEENAVEIVASPQVFLEVVFGSRNFLGAILTGKVKVRGIRNILSVLMLLRMLRITSNVYLSNADRL